LMEWVSATTRIPDAAALCVDQSPPPPPPPPRGSPAGGDDHGTGGIAVPGGAFLP
jgi:hypothetical protein